MTQHDNGGPAFPDPARAGGHCMETGMTLRDWFAGQALAGLMAHYGTPEGASINEGPRRAYIIADAMMEARK